jgi:hypothetical protein
MRTCWHVSRNALCFFRRRSSWASFRAQADTSAPAVEPSCAGRSKWFNVDLLDIVYAPTCARRQKWTWIGLLVRSHLSVPLPLRVDAEAPLECYFRPALTSPALPPEEAAAVPPLKKRKRQRTSPVVEKITYACHHSGTYTSRHSATLPAAKLRMNTKKSVKCDCQAKIIASEMDSGEMRVAYHWRHTGHGALYLSCEASG